LRVNSTVAQQALYLMNNALVRQLSRQFARRISDQSLDTGRQVELAYLTALSRQPSEQERQWGRETLRALSDHWQAQPTGDADPLSDATSDATSDPQLMALAVFCHTLMNSAEFLYVD
jgi:hypothetical protein